ncbi:MAG: hypothetical protein D084_Lepto4C00565G0002, partial [Leptospirillum sp. Group IV 'UBA BS']
MITTSQGHDASLLLIGAKLAGSLLFVLALFLVGVWVVRLLQRQKLLSPRRPENEIEIRSTRSLGPRSQIALVSVAGNSFLVGIAPSGSPYWEKSTSPPPVRLLLRLRFPRPPVL